MRRKEKRNNITRREFLTFLGLAGLGGTIMLLRSCLGKEKAEEINKKIEEDKEKGILTALKEINKKLKKIEDRNEPYQYNLQDLLEVLKNKELNYPIKAYFIDDSYLALDTLWEEKNDYVEEKFKDEDLILKFRKLKEKILKNFAEHYKGYIENSDDFKKYLSLVISESLIVLDLEKIFDNDRYKFDEMQKIFIRNLLREENLLKLLNKTLFCLILVEICYADKDTEINKEILNYLLARRGLRFLVSIPAIFDKVLSFGPFQISEFVIGENKDKFYPINYINRFVIEFSEEERKEFNLPIYKLPERLDNFDLRDHFRAEIYLLIYYFLELVKNVDIEILKNAYKEDEGWFFIQLCYYWAGCHHLPYLTQKLFKEFLEDNNNIKNKKSFADFIQDKNENLNIYLNRFREILKGAE